MPRITEVVWTGGAAEDLQGVFESESSGDYARGEEFLLAADAALELLKRFPERGALVVHSTRLRRILLGRKRQLGLYYSLIGARLIVAALIDLRQAPEKIKAILDERMMDS